MGFVRDAELLLAVLMLTNDAAAGSNTALCRTHGETCSSHDAAQCCRGFLCGANDTCFKAPWTAPSPAVADGEPFVWPTPLSLVSSGPPLPLAPDFAFVARGAATVPA